MRLAMALALGLLAVPAAAGDKLFRRALRRKGVWPGQPVKPPMPRL
jgi:hypothetical protein